VLNDHLKLIQTRTPQDWKWEAYDLGKDPAEKKNLVELNADIVKTTEFAALRSLLNEQKEDSERAFGQHKNPTLDEEQKEMLRDLGYIAQ
jgi:hypothetical protein